MRWSRGTSRPELLELRLGRVGYLANGDGDSSFHAQAETHGGCGRMTSGNAQAEQLRVVLGRDDRRPNFGIL